MKKTLTAILMAATTLSFGAQASATGTKADEVKPVKAASSELKSGDWSAAERALLQTSFSEEDQIFAKLNMAFLYSATGRTEQASVIYNEIIEGRDNPFAMVLSGTPRRVKNIARDGLKRIAMQ